MITHNSIGYSGRLGNQMFQYAALKAVSLHTGFECFIPNNLAIKPDGAYDFTNQKWLEYRLDLPDCFKISSPILENKPTKVYQERGFEFDASIFSINDDTALEGYFQSYKYFSEYQNEITDEFTFRDSILSKCKNIINQYSDPISIHVRRGDYVKHPGFWNVTPEYLAQALSSLPYGNYTYLVFSDDIEWCKQIFNEDFTFIEDNNQFEDMCLMSLCKHNIISNSSFSWWAAWLNSNPDKTVVAPSKWFTEAKPLKDLFPNNWIVL